jgi:hypothetical protein
MNPDWTILTCTFPDRDTAIQIARALGGNDELEAFPQAGYLDGIRYDIAEWGEVRTPATAFDPETGAPTAGNEVVPGWHMGGIWRGPVETVPPEIMAFQVDRSALDWWPRFG